MDLKGSWLSLSVSDWPLCYGFNRSSLRRALVKSNADGASARMQLTSRRQCKRVVKSMQLRNLLVTLLVTFLLII